LITIDVFDGAWHHEWWCCWMPAVQFAILLQKFKLFFVVVS
jgi:hypothetical protein